MARLSYENIQKQILKLQEQAKKLEAGRDAKKLKAISQVNSLMKKLHITIEDLQVSLGKVSRNKSPNGPKAAKPRKPSTTRPPVLPKYRDEVSGQTWTGRGKPPLWLKAMLDQGKTKEDFLIQNAVSETPEQ